MVRSFALLLGLAVMLAFAYAEPDELSYHGFDDEIEAGARSENVAVEARNSFVLEGNDPEIPRIYFIPDEWVDYYADLSTTLYPRSFQIPITGLSNPKLKVVSGTANVTESGEVFPSITTWYCAGALCTTRVISNWDTIKHDYYASVANISVTADGVETQYYVINVTDYPAYVSYNKMSNILSQIIQDGMTQYQMLEAITRWVAENTDYNSNHTATALMIYDAGDYYAISGAIAMMAKMVGINATTRRAGQDPGEYRGQNVLAVIDGKYIAADAGFNENGKTRPRPYSLYELEYAFTMYDTSLVQYDGWNKTVVIPNIVNNSEVKTLGRKSDWDVFEHPIEEVHLPATLNAIVTAALDYKITGLRWIEVDPLNEKYYSQDGVLYYNNSTVLYLAPRKLSQPLVIHENTTTIAQAALAYRAQTELVIPSHVTYLSKGAFFYANISDITIEPGLQTVGEACFKYAVSKKVVLPDTVTKMYNGPFYFAKVDEVVLSKNCPTLPDGVFQESWVYKAVIPDGVEVIGGRNFYHTHNIYNVTLPRSVKSIKTEAFSSSSVVDIFYEGTIREWCNITMATAIPSTITIHFVDGESMPATDVVCPSESSSESSTPVISVPGSDVSKESSTPVISVPASDVSGDEDIVFFGDDGSRQMLSAIWVLLTLCLCLVFH